MRRRRAAARSPHELLRAERGALLLLADQSTRGRGGPHGQRARCETTVRHRDSASSQSEVDAQGPARLLPSRRTSAAVIARCRLEAPLQAAAARCTATGEAAEAGNIAGSRDQGWRTARGAAPGRLRLLLLWQHPGRQAGEGQRTALRCCASRKSAGLASAIAKQRATLHRCARAIAAATLARRGDARAQGAMPQGTLPMTCPTISH